MNKTDYYCSAMCQVAPLNSHRRKRVRKTLQAVSVCRIILPEGYKIARNTPCRARRPTLAPIRDLASRQSWQLRLTSQGLRKFSLGPNDLVNSGARPKTAQASRLGSFSVCGAGRGLLVFANAKEPVTY